MKYGQNCPKCESQDIIRVPGYVGPHNSGNNIPMGITIFSSVKVTRYVCGACGFSEEWLDSPDDIERLRQKYDATR
jgi:Zn ribbon nucleic-acid-binding protein